MKTIKNDSLVFIIIKKYDIISMILKQHWFGMT